MVLAGWRRCVCLVSILPKEGGCDGGGERGSWSVLGGWGEMVVESADESRGIWVLGFVF